jgi:hypothetical protein
VLEMMPQIVKRFVICQFTYHITYMCFITYGFITFGDLDATMYV